jgi:hypothetical protein
VTDDTSATDDQALAEYAAALAEGIAAAVPRLVERSVDRLYRAWSGPPPPAVAEAARRSGQEALAAVDPAVRSLLEADVDDQRTTPLSILRHAVRYPTAVLAAAGVPEVVRDPMDEAMFPDDPYGLTPAALGDVDPGLAGLGIAWGAAKASVHRRRHRRGT